VTRPRRILVLYRHVRSDGMLEAVRKHLHVLDGRGHDVRYANAIAHVPESLRLVDWDAVVLHTTFLTMRWHVEFHTWKWPLRWLDDLDCLKIAIPQDEYDHAHVLDDWLHELGVDVVFTNFDEHQRPALYPLLHGSVEFERCLTGYVDGDLGRLSAPPPLDRRPLDLVYRARNLPYQFGSHGQLKHLVAVEAASAARRLGLEADVSTHPDDTVTGERWLGFLASGRATVGAESGSSVLDRRGEIRSAIERLLRADPSLSFDEVSARMPKGWDDYSFAAIGPRHLEAVATKTPQVLVEGRYDGILEPERHYLPVARDLGNLEEALARTRDLRSMQRLVDTAHEEIVAGGRYSYDAFADQILSWIDRAPARVPRPLEWPSRRAAGALDDGARAIARTAARTPSLLWLLLNGRRIVRAGGASAKLVLGTPEARRLLVDGYRRGALSRPDRFARELLHLNTIRRARLDTNRGFSTETRLVGNTLTLVSGQAAGRNGVDGALDAVEAGAVEEIAWQKPGHDDMVELHQLAALARACPAATARLLQRFIDPPTT
jgi:hypothetical protein